MLDDKSRIENWVSVFFPYRCRTRASLSEGYNPTSKIEIYHKAGLAIRFGKQFKKFGYHLSPIIRMVFSQPLSGCWPMH
jgi:hypothetical protein